MISILVPTRKRSEWMKRLVKSIFETAAHDVEIIFYIDDDDITSIDTFHQIENESINGIIGERIVLSEMWNRCYDIAKGPIYMHCGDDVIFRTNQWDNLIYNEFEEFEDRILFAFGADGLVDSDKLGTHGFLHDNWVKTVGYFVPPYFSWCYNDTWLTEVATMINRKRYIPEIYIEHMHPAAQKSKMDDTYNDAHRRGVIDNCKKIYDSKKEERIQDAKKLEEFIKNFAE